MDRESSPWSRIPECITFMVLRTIHEPFCASLHAIRSSPGHQRFEGRSATLQNALQQDLPGDVRTVIERQFREVQANHDRIKELRNITA